MRRNHYNPGLMLVDNLQDRQTDPPYYLASVHPELLSSRGVQFRLLYHSDEQEADVKTMIKY